MVACGNQKGCCWLGSAGCQLSSLPHSHAVQPSPAGLLLSKVTGQSYGPKHLLSLAMLMGFASVEDRTYEVTKVPP